MMPKGKILARKAYKVPRQPVGTCHVVGHHEALFCCVLEQPYPWKTERMHQLAFGDCCASTI